MSALTANIELFSQPYMSLLVSHTSTTLPNSVRSTGSPDGENEKFIDVLDQPDQQKSLHDVIIVVDDRVLEEGVVDLESPADKPGVRYEHGEQAVPKNDLVLAAVDEVGLQVDNSLVLQLCEM